MSTARRGHAVASRPRNKQAHTFLNEEEKAKLRERAAAMGMTQSAYLRYLVVNDFGLLGKSSRDKKETA